MNFDKYLSRIGLSRTGLTADKQGLYALQRSHLLNIPFENLDIHWKRPLTLDLERLFDKIVAKNRGGFCYELNGLFNELLISLGFRTRLVSARVFNGSTYGPEFDHAAIIVTIGEDKYLADVGFGDFSAEPLLVDFDKEQVDKMGTFVLKKCPDSCVEVFKYEAEDLVSQYIFCETPHELSEFAEMCDFQQHSPESHFRKGKLCSLMTESGRKTLTDNNFLVTKYGEKTEQTVDSEEEFEKVLMQEFGIAPKPKSDSE